MSSGVGQLLKTASKLHLGIRVVLGVHNCCSKTNTYPDNHRFFHETQATFLNHQNPVILRFWFVFQIPGMGSSLLLDCLSNTQNSGSSLILIFRHIPGNQQLLRKSKNRPILMSSPSCGSHEDKILGMCKLQNSRILQKCTMEKWKFQHNF